MSNRLILPGVAGAEPSPGAVDWGRSGGGGVEGGASSEIPMQQRTYVILLFIKQVQAMIGVWQTGARGLSTPGRTCAKAYISGWNAGSILSIPGSIGQQLY